MKARLWMTTLAAAAALACHGGPAWAESPAEPGWPEPVPEPAPEPEPAPAPVPAQAPDLEAVAGATRGVINPCPGSARPAVLSLADVVTRALCNDPRTRQSWALTRIDAAQVDLALTAYRPTLAFNMESSIAHGTFREIGVRQIDRGTRTITQAELDFGLLLFDFGQRNADTQVARQTLLAATAAHDANLQAVLLEASDAYYALVTSRGALRINDEVQEFASQMLDASMAKHRDSRGLDMADRMEARVAVAEAALNQSTARSDLRRASSKIATLLGESPNTVIEVEPDEDRTPDAQFAQDIEALMRQAQESHPSIRAAQARAQAARAGVDAARLGSRPQLRFVARASRDRDVFGARTNERRIGLQLHVPLFDGFERDARQRIAHAELRAADADLQEARRSVALDVWDAYETLQTETATVEHASRVLDASRELLELQQSRYRGGTPEPDRQPASPSGRAPAAAPRAPVAATPAPAPMPVVARVGTGGTSLSAMSTSSSAEDEDDDDEDDSDDDDEDTDGDSVKAGSTPPPMAAPAAVKPAPALTAPKPGARPAAPVAPTTKMAQTDKKAKPAKADEADTPDLIDVLDAHRTVADNALKRLEALSNWRAARLRLAASLGQLGLWSVNKP